MDNVKLLEMKVQQTQATAAHNLSRLLYADDFPPIKLTRLARIKRAVSTCKSRVSNAWDALCGKLDYEA